MSDHYIIGENHQVAAVEDAGLVRSVVVNDVIYAYWRHSDVGTNDNTAVIKMSSSADGRIWTAPVTVYDPSALDPLLAGITHNGTNFYLAVGEKNTTTGAVTTKILSSAAGTVFSSPVTVTWTDYWACPTDLVYSGTTYYLAATARTTFDGPMRSTVKTSTNLSAWTSLGYASQLNSVDNVHPRLAVTTTEIRVVMREGTFDNIGYEEDRILFAKYSVGAWGPTEVLVTGSGNPVITAVDGVHVVIYQDTSTTLSNWCWGIFDDEQFRVRGTFVQSFAPSNGGTVFAYEDGFAAVYGQRPEGGTAGSLYFRAFYAITESPQGNFQPKTLAERPRGVDDSLENFSVEVSFGDLWLSLSDGFRYYMSAEDFGEKAQTRRRVTAASPFFDGTYLIHSTLENVNETMTVGVLGHSQNDVTENILLLESVISQPSFKIRMTMGDHSETWSCQSADYTISRGHVMMHNVRAMMRLSVPRLPAVTYEVI